MFTLLVLMLLLQPSLLAISPGVALAAFFAQQTLMLAAMPCYASLK
jgi:hypothetical protein